METEKLPREASGDVLQLSNQTVDNLEEGIGKNSEFPLPRPRDYRSSKENLEISNVADRITYKWRNLNVWTPGSDAKVHNKDPEKEGCCKKMIPMSKHILKNPEDWFKVTGYVKPGELLVIMGASGAGKTTLLNVLNFRTTGGLRVTGERCLNGVAVSPASLTSVSAYIQQDDLFISTLTVREHLIFQARLRMHSHIPYKDRLERVEYVIKDLGLSKCSNSKIGSPGRVKGISGGEMKRLSVASEILTDPPLLFCDEPTSGLDSYMSMNIVKTLKTLAAQGKTILCTIHQPSSPIFQLFDRLLLLAEGRVAFMGDTEKAIEFFRLNGYPCPEKYNPADYYIHTLAIHPGSEDESKENLAKLSDAFDKSEDGRLILEGAAKETADPTVVKYLEEEAKKNFKSPYKASWIGQFRAVLWRAWLAIYKDPKYIGAKFVQNIVVAIVIGMVYWQQELTTNGIRNINGALFTILLNLSFGNALSAIDSFLLEVPIFMREHYNGMYRTEVYFLAKITAEIPFYTIFPFLAVCASYFMVGLKSDYESFFITAGVYVLVTNCAVSIGYFASCFASSLVVVLSLLPTILLPLVLFGGLLMNADTIPFWLNWMKYVSWFYYGNEALCIVQWRGVGRVTCDPPDIGNICPNGNFSGIGCSIYEMSEKLCPDGASILKELSFREEHLFRDVICLAGLILAIRLAGLIALFGRSYRKV